MPRRERIPAALTIAGSDSGGGAGVQADLKTFAALGVHGTSAITCVTAQNPRGVRGVHPCPPAIISRQIEAVLDEFPPAAVKTGMLFSAGIIRRVANYFDRDRQPPLIVDPVMVATSGARLLQATAIRVLRDRLLPRATLVTPNLDEASILVDRPLKSVDDLRSAARQIRARYGCAALVKGGHLRGLREAVDIFYDGRIELLLKAPFIKGLATHGTGCTYSAAVTACLALGCDLPRAVERAKRFVTRAIARSHVTGRHWVLNLLCRT